MTQDKQDIIDNILGLIWGSKFFQARKLWDKHKNDPDIGYRFEVIGEHLVPIPERPPDDKIAKNSEVKQDQVFTYTQVPNCWLPKTLRSIAEKQYGFGSGRNRVIDYEWYQREGATTQEMDRFASQEWERRAKGYWFYNNGVPTYVTGTYYLHLNYGRADKGRRIEYRDRHRRWTLFWDYVKRHPRCKGMIVLKPRRVGDTTIAGTVCLEIPTRINESNVGIQSKTEGDLKQIRQKMRRAWDEFPGFFRVTNSGFTNGGIDFKKKAGPKYTNKVELDSKIAWGASSPKLFDGWALQLWYGDEQGKREDGKFIENLNIILECLSEGANIVGKALITSTVEEMTKGGGAQYKEVADASGIRELDGNGFTKSGLFEFFTPAFDGYSGFIDKYGMSVIDEPDSETLDYLIRRAKERGDNDLDKYKMGARKFLHNLREGKKGVGNSYNSIRRKYPFTRRECFIADGKETPLPIEGVTTRILELEEFERREVYLTERGNFEWNDPQNWSKGVYWSRNKNGKWEMDRKRGLPSLVGNKENAIATVRSQLPQYRYQSASDDYMIGVDPYDKRTNNDLLAKMGKNGLSLGAITVLERPNPLAVSNGVFDHEKPDELWASGNIVCTYFARPADPDVLYEDVAKTAWFYGSKMNIEKNKDGLHNYLLKKGLALLILAKYNPGSKGGVFTQNMARNAGTVLEERGQYTNDVLHEYFVKLQASWILRHAPKCTSLRSLRQLESYEDGAEGRLDLYISHSLALMGIEIDGSRPTSPLVTIDINRL